MADKEKVATPKAGKKDTRKVVPKKDGAPTDIKEKRKKIKKKKDYGGLSSGMYKYCADKRDINQFSDRRVTKKKKPKKKLFIIKPIGGEKNGGTRVVYLKKHKKSYPTMNRIHRRPTKIKHKPHKLRLRKSLVPGTIVILLAGVHKGRRAVFLKQMDNALILVTGPYTLNGVPMRRIHQKYVIATSTKIDISSIQIPEHINSKYFKRIRPKKSKKEDGDIFVSKKVSYKASDQRKTDQKTVDSQVIKAIHKSPESKLLKKYLCTMFGLRTNMYPHRMKF